MPRRPRLLSETGFYHVIMRGVGRQILFEENKDFIFFLRQIEKYSKETEVKICAYCLMSNHVHLLVQDSAGRLSLMMKKTGVSYSGYFNRKYDRVGHLFQGRFLSEIIKSEGHLMRVFRYILNNPQKAGICAAGAYKWSSYNAYGDDSSFVDTELLEELIGGWPQYIAFMKKQDNEEHMDCDKPANNDKWAKAVIRELLGENQDTDLSKCSRNNRNEYIRKFRERGLSIRQIERITGIPRGVIQKVK